MKYTGIPYFAALLIILSLPASSTAQPAPYTEGSVWAITFVRTKPGMGDDYFRSLATSWRTTNDELKKQGLILSYKILSSDATNKDDWDLMLLTEYKNMAALDVIDEKSRAISTKVVGTEEQQKTVMVKRIDMREIIGTKLARELILK